MGEMIRRNAAAEDIIADVEATLTNAVATGGVWKDLAEEQLSNVVALINDVDARLETATSALEPLLAGLDAKNDEADALLGRISDEIWNEVGRPASDAALSVLFPGGIAYYADGSVEKQPGRMDLLVELLESRVHPRLAPDQVKAHVKEIRASSRQLRVAVDAVSGPSERVELLERVRRALATVAHADLTSLKRLYKNAHFSEADIHAVIPSRPAPSRRPATAPPDSAPQPGAAAGALP